MSTGADCVFYQPRPDTWWYKLQRWPYGDWPEYDKYGPFSTLENAIEHMDSNHANPGGWVEIPYEEPATVD